METCPYCHAIGHQIKAGRNRSGSQRYRCKLCGHRYTPGPNPNGYPDEVHLKAVQLYLAGMSLRAVGQALGVNHQSVINWVNAYIASLPLRKLRLDKSARLDKTPKIY